MSSEEKCHTETAHNLVEPIINGKENEPKRDYTESNEKLVGDKLEAMTPNKYEADTRLEISLSPPPRRKFGRMASMRKTSKDKFTSNQNEICDTLLITDNQNSNHQNDATFLVTRSDESKLKDYNELLTSDAKKSEQLKESATQYLSSDTIKKEVHKSYVRSDSKAENHAFSRSLMDRMRRWRTQWITSEEAKASRRRKFNRFLYFIRVFLTHLFSTTGLCLLVIAYSCMGALIFTFLESKNEVKQRHHIHKERIDCASDLWNYTLTLNIFYPEKWNDEAIERLKLFEERIVKAVREDGYGGATDQWTFSGALLYSVTVITTIGYGNVTCKTDWGRIVTMIYALIGIPVMFLCLANLGNLMAQTFRFSYKRICCICFCCCDTLSAKYSKKNKPNLKSYDEKIELQKCDTKQMPETEKEVKVSFCENEDQKLRSIIALTPSTPPTTSVTSSEASSPVKSLASTPVKSTEVVVVQHSVKSDEDRVPIWLVILLVIGYIMGGAFMFSIWEEEWGALEGAYFCFTTLTTIGFGDLVPGSAKFSDNKEEQTKFIICCAYLIVGLSLLAMSFNLVQEEIVIRSKEIARRMGIIPEPDPITAV